MDTPALDPTIHQPARLKIMMLLAASEFGVFNELARDAALTPGNLAAHLKTLEGAGYVESLRGFVDRKPRVRYRLTEAGREGLRAYCRALEEALRDIQRAVGADPRSQ